MEINEILIFLKEIPTWGWVVLAIVIFFLFGDRKRWEYEVKFSLVDGVGRGEVEIESVGNKIFRKREKRTVETELDLNLEAQGKVYEVFLNGLLIQIINKNKTITSRVRARDIFTGEIPHSGDNVEIKHLGTVVFSGKLHKD